MPIQNYQDLLVWQRAMKLVKQIYVLTKKLPKSEVFILCSQMLRAAISVPSNISEGFARNRPLEFIRFLEIAFGSLCELETQILIAQEEYQIDCKEIKQSITELQKMLRSLINKTKH
jgi:four helix bundle protein